MTVRDYLSAWVSYVLGLGLTALMVWRAPFEDPSPPALGVIFGLATIAACVACIFGAVVIIGIGLDPDWEPKAKRPTQAERQVQRHHAALDAAERVFEEEVRLKVRTDALSARRLEFIAQLETEQEVAS